MKRMSVILVMVAVLAGPALADTTYVEIGSPYVKNCIPFWGDWYDAYRVQLLYLQSEINHAGRIVCFGLSSTEDSPGRFYNVTALLCHTSVSALVSSFVANYGGNTPVVILQADTLIVGTGQNLTWYYFPSDFEYNNTDNLLLEISWRGDEGRRVKFWRNPNGSTDRRCSTPNDTAKYGSPDDVQAYHARIGFIPTGVAEPKEQLPARSSLSITPTHGPPPFRISCKGQLSGEPQLTIWDATGRLVDHLEPALISGQLEATWAAQGIPAGVYLCRLESSSGSTTATVTVVR